jgi:carboxypeptidase T
MNKEIQMIKYLILGFVLFSGIAFAQNSEVQDGQIVRFKLTEKVRKFLKENEYDVTGVNYKTGHIEALLTPAELRKIEALETKIEFSFPQTLLAGPDKEYKSPEEIEEFIQEMHGRYPDITAIKSIGKSLEGRDIWAIKISDNAKLDEKEPTILVNGMHHAREVMTPEITTDMIEYLLTNYKSNDEVTHWVDSTEIWIIPMLNVDGNNKVWEGSSMWRKNTRGGFGVDINRNYPYGWNSCKGSSENKGAQDYRGEAPASEPETQAMMNLVAEIKPVMNISYHSYSEIVIYPYGCRPNRTPSEEAVEQIGAEIGKLLDYKPGTAWELLYNADGGDIDWMYTAHQVIPFVIEVNSTWQGFQPSYSKWRDKTVERNRPGWMHLLKRLHGPSLQGIVKNKALKEIHLSRSGEGKTIQSYKINPDGTFFIMLQPGRYDVRVEGAERRVLSNLDVQGKVILKI